MAPPKVINVPAQGDKSAKSGGVDETSSVRVGPCEHGEDSRESTW
jgi:hypothetical protein